MHILRSAWLFIGTFGCGAAVGSVVATAIGKRLAEPHPGEWFEPLFRMFVAVVGMFLLPLLTGLVAVSLGFAARRAGRDWALPYLAVLGNGFLLLAAGWIVWTITRPR